MHGHVWAIHSMAASKVETCVESHPRPAVAGKSSSGPACDKTPRRASDVCALVFGI